MELFDIPPDVIRQIMIFYIDNSKVNQKKIEFIGSRRLNEISESINININIPTMLELLLSNDDDIRDVDYVDGNGNTALIYACGCDLKKRALKILNMDCDCKLKQINIFGNSALICAQKNTMTEVIKKIQELI
jgi:ankyrin repeat protein